MCAGPGVGPLGFPGAAGRELSLNVIVRVPPSCSAGVSRMSEQERAPQSMTSK